MTYSGGSQPPGWYHAHGDPTDTQRYWDGAAWVGAPRPAPGSGDSGLLSAVALPVPRVVARIIDWVMWLAIRAAVAVLIGLAIGEPSADDPVARALGPILGALLVAVYEAFMVSRIGATVGKMALGLWVRTADGAELDFAGAFRRAVPVVGFGLLEGLVLWRSWWLGALGAIAVLVAVTHGVVRLFTDPRRQTLWDQLAGTVVINRNLVGKG